MGAVIKTIDGGSPALKKLIAGDELLSVNGNKIIDVLDYKFYTYESDLTLAVSDAKGRRKLVRVKKPPGADLGLTFESYLMDEARDCSNRCLFCFVDQLPSGMRESLYFKDDDARLSFLTGSYITLTNLSEREIERVIALKISPINVSVHATDEKLRSRLLGNRQAARGYDTIKRLAGGGITMNCQIVCCPGINDGENLSRTMTDLAELYPGVNSVSVVPVGLTKHRAGLFPLVPFDSAGAAETISRAQSFAVKCLKKHGSRIFFCADEFYIKAGLPLPEDEYYEGYPQLENGVGLITLFREEFLSAMESAAAPAAREITPFSVATGVSAAPYITELLDAARGRFGGFFGAVYPIVNNFFGQTIDVAGLITGAELIETLRGRELGRRLLIPRTMLRHGEGVFLDDVTVSEAEDALGVPVCAVEPRGDAFLNAILRDA